MKLHKVFKNTYYDSVSLMSLTAKLNREYEFIELVILMGSEMNLEMIQAVGLFHDDMKGLTPNDLILAAETSNSDLKEKWVEIIFKHLNEKKVKSSQSQRVYRSITAAKKDVDANIAVISVPGRYAANEARVALENNMHVMLFSDNVTIEDEIVLKDLAIEKDLLLMGPDCGTAIINGKGLCFANNVSKGNIGLVAASGTGLQEVTVIIDRFGGGISQAIGVGGRDLSELVGGKMLLKAYDDLEKDEETEVIVLVSKPPHKSVAEKIYARLKSIVKQTVVCFLDSHSDYDAKDVYFASSLAGAALKALELTGTEVEDNSILSSTEKQMIKEAKLLLHDDQTKLKGLFCGGTLTTEALSIIREHVVSITSNIAKKKHEKMMNPFSSDGHVLVDMGDDVFTNGKPHPMIEPMIRLKRIIEESKNPETAVILLDFELGYGSHEDPVGVTIDTIKKAQIIAEKANRHLTFVAYVCGTSKDKQDLEKSEKMLRENGVIVTSTNAKASFIAAQIVKEVA